MDFDAKRARLRKPDMFESFKVPDKGKLLTKVNLNPEVMLLIVEFNNTRRVLLVRIIIIEKVLKETYLGSNL